MNIRDEEQLQQYFERGMTSAQEQNFLINVAARDDMRLAFRSQLELLKAVREDKDASGSPTFVRSKTLTALGLGAALVPSSLKKQEAETASFAPSFLQNIGSAFRRPMVSLTAGLLFGILGSSFFMARPVNEPAAAIHPAIIAPAVQQAPQVVTTAPAVQEPVKANISHKSIGTTMTERSHVGTQTPSDHSTPITNEMKPGTVKTKTNIQKPEDTEKK